MGCSVWRDGTGPSNPRPPPRRTHQVKLRRRTPALRRSTRRRSGSSRVRFWLMIAGRNSPISEWIRGYGLVIRLLMAGPSHLITGLKPFMCFRYSSIIAFRNSSSNCAVRDEAVVQAEARYAAFGETVLHVDCDTAVESGTVARLLPLKKKYLAIGLCFIARNFKTRRTPRSAASPSPPNSWMQAFTASQILRQVPIATVITSFANSLCSSVVSSPQSLYGSSCSSNCS